MKWGEKRLRSGGVGGLVGYWVGGWGCGGGGWGVVAGADGSWCVEWWGCDGEGG